MLHSRDAAVREEVPVNQSVAQIFQESEDDRLARWEHVRPLGLLEPARRWYFSGKPVSLNGGQHSTESSQKVTFGDPDLPRD